MLSACKHRLVCAIVLSVGLLVLSANVDLAAQGTTGTILGTVTDSSGGTVPEASNPPSPLNPSWLPFGVNGSVAGPVIDALQFVSPQSRSYRANLGWLENAR